MRRSSLNSAQQNSPLRIACGYMSSNSFFDVRNLESRAKETRIKTSALLLVVSSLSLIACGGDNKNPSPGPSGTSTPTSAEGGSSSTSEGPKTTSNGTGTSGDGGTKS